MGGNSVRVSDRSPGKLAGRASRQSCNRHDPGNYSVILDSSNMMQNKTAEQSTRKTSKIVIDDSTQKVEFKGMLNINKPQQKP